MLYPMLLMVLLTLIVGLIAVTVRFNSVKGGRVSAKYFKLMNGEQVPEMVTLTTRCFNNQFEIPVLFYVVCTLYITLGVDSVAGLLFAWLFVIFRVIHAYIHLTYNHIIHRMSAFWLSFIAVIAMWLILIGKQF